MNRIDDYVENFINVLIAYSPKLIAALVTLIIGLLVIKLFRFLITRLMNKRKLDPTLLRFVMDVITWIFRILLFVSVITKLGVETSSFVAAIGAASLAIGLSLQGSLSNFAGGLLIILFKPLRVGDYIEAQGEAGTVSAIQIFSTRLITSNNQVIYLPNGSLSNGTIRNFSKEPNRRAELVIGVSYNTDLKKAKEVLKQVILNDSKILKQPEPAIQVKELAENSVNFVVYIWSTRADYGDMVSDFYENTKEALEKAGIEIPSPQRDITIKKSNPEN